jgi:hypothetical protein
MGMEVPLSVFVVRLLDVRKFVHVGNGLSSVWTQRPLFISRGYTRTAFSLGLRILEMETFLKGVRT